MISVNDFKRGVVIKLDGELYSVIEYQHVKPARGAAFVRSKIRHMKKGSVVERTFRGGEKVEDVKIVKRQMQYLYEEGDDLVFMDTESYEQESIPKKAIGDALKFIKEQDMVDIAMYEGEAIEPATLCL